MKPKGYKEPTIRDMLDAIEERRGTYIKSRYYVVEVTPSKSYYSGDGHGGSELNWTNAKQVRVSEYANTRLAVEKFIEAHDPDKGNTLEIREDKLYRQTTETWY